MKHRPRNRTLIQALNQAARQRIRAGGGYTAHERDARRQETRLNLTPVGRNRRAR